MANVQGTWRVLLCDKFGQTISNISAVCFGKQLVETLNRPAQFTFWCPANDSRVAGLCTKGSLDNVGDSQPFLNDTRSVRAYRYERQGDGSYQWVIRFAGHVWLIEDVGDGDSVRSHVTCFDPLMMLNHRIARRMIWLKTASAASPIMYPYWYYGDPNSYQFSLWDDTSSYDPQAGQSLGSKIVSVPGTDVARGLLNATNYYEGFTGMDDYYLNQHMNEGYAYPSGGRTYVADQRPPASGNVSPTYDNKVVADGIIELASQYNGFDFQVVPTDGYYGSSIFSVGDTPDYRVAPLGQTGWTAPLYGLNSYAGGPATVHDHTTFKYQALALLKFYVPIRGTTLPNVVFAYAAPPHNVSSMSLVTDKTNLANHNRVIGKGRQSFALSAPSINKYGHVFMRAPITADITDKALLDALAAEATNLGSTAQQTVTFSPANGPNQFLPYDNFNIGDYVRVVAGAKLRGGFSGYQRVWSWTLDIADDHRTETLSSVGTSPVTY